jgi:RimJ/RimL family protein N-acetyltransferase
LALFYKKERFLLGFMMFYFQPDLMGDLLHLRPLRAQDHDGLFVAGGDPEVWAVHPHPERATAAGFRAYFDEQLASGGALVAVDRGGGALAGCSRFSTLYAEPGEVEIGWTFLGRAYWGGAYNADMKRLMLRHAFGYVERVIFRIGEHNVRSRRAVEKIGGVLSERVQNVTVAGAPGRNVYYTIDRAAFDVSPLNRPGLRVPPL